MRLTSEQERKILFIKAKKILKKLKNGVKFTPTQPDILKIQQILLDSKNFQKSYSKYP